jgi:ABC-type antimicrobial peptide transport system permease subunit
MYAWNELKRRTVRSILTGLGSALSAALLTLLLGVTLQQRGMLGGTLLGEFILVNVEGYHYAIVAIGLGLAFLSTFNGLLGSILERRREIGVLKAIGWRTASIARLFIAQGLLLGIVGGSFGTLAGSLAFLYFYKSASPGLALAILLGMSLPGLVGALAALYPARLAARVPPAETVRYE